MITNPFILSLIFIFVVSLVYVLSNDPKTKKIFYYLPTPLWCYFIPTVLSSIGWLPANSPAYPPMSRFLLPASLILLLIATDVPALFKLSRKAMLAMLMGSIGIGAGAVITFFMVEKMARSGMPALQGELWKGWGCLSGSWTGGSANMIAVREILQPENSLFSNLIVVDTLIAYAWMAVLIFLSQRQEWINKKLNIPNVLTLEDTAIAGLGVSVPALHFSGFRKILNICLLLLMAFGLGSLCIYSSQFLPAAGAILNPYTLTIIFATSVPLLLSLTPAKKLESLGASETGKFLLFLLLTTVGVRANLSGLISAPVFIILGLLWVLIHGIILAVGGKIFKIPVALLATSSQANVGGPISAPIVASMYQKELAPVGILLAILGNIYGTYFGLIISQICRMISNLL